MSMKFFWTLAALTPVAASTSAIAQEPVPYQQPTYQQPPPNYQPPPTTQPPPTYQQPPPTYQQPQPTYQQPPPNYQQPPPNYQQPPPNYQQPPGYYPPPNYQQPPPAYPPAQQPATSQQAANKQQQAKAQKQSGIQYHPFRFQIEGGYSITTGDLKPTLQNGGNVGLGLTWFPTSTLPLGFRVDASYSRFYFTQAGLEMEAPNFPGTTLYSGQQNIYGGDADAELDLRMGPNVKEYFFGGFGWYRTETIFKQAMYQPGQVCNFFFCTPGQVPVISTVSQNTTGWMDSWNAGMGFEFSLGDPVTLFIDARYVKIAPYSKSTGFVPIRVGLRF